MPSRPSLAALALVAGIGASALPAHAQSGDAIPRDLVSALLADYGYQGRPPAIVVGRVPAGIPPEVVPEGARVLGGLEVPGTPGAMRLRQGMLVIALDGDTRAASATMRRHLEARGWRAPGGRGARGGFTTAVRLEPDEFCRDGTMLSVGVATLDARRARVSLEVVRETPDGDPCGERPERPSRMPFDGAPELPELAPPPGAFVHGSNSGDNGHAVDHETRLETALSPLATLRHYAALLREAGWTIGAPAEQAGIAVARVTPPARGELRWQGTLTVVAAEGAPQRDVLLRLFTADPR